MAISIGIKGASILVIATLLGCGSEPPPVSVTSRPVKTMVAEGLGSSGVRDFPGRIEANRRAELSFRVQGKINNIVVKEGDAVAENQLLAELENTDYRLRLNDRQAQFENARKTYQRGVELVARGAISQMDFDRMEANYKSSQANFEAAQQEMEYTRLKAPFTGMVARRHVQIFEEVQAKQVVFSLQDISSLEVKVDVPESIVRSIRRLSNQDEIMARRDATPANAFFPQYPDITYPLVFKEAATQADPKTQTFEVTFAMDTPEDISVLPGMTMSVNIDLSLQIGPSGTVMVPSSAVGGDVTLQPLLWVVDEQTMTVTARPVAVGSLEGSRIEVVSGLQGGERIVVAGVGALAEGMAVTLIENVEQAEPTSPTSVNL